MSTAATPLSLSDVVAEHIASFQARGDDIVLFRLALFPRDIGIVDTPSFGMILPAKLPSARQIPARNEIEDIFTAMPPEYSYPLVLKQEGNDIVIRRGEGFNKRLTPDSPSFTWWRDVFGSAKKKDAMHKSVGCTIKYVEDLHVKL